MQTRSLRARQWLFADIIHAFASATTGIGDILPVVSPGNGKRLMSIIAAAWLIESGLVHRVCCLVRPDRLRC
jgi:hypothetical protein